jgi:Domain of unknown function (DUF4391)
MDSLNIILQIPERSLVNKKITKSFFKRNFELSSSEKALLDDFNILTAIDWLASVSPDNSNINRFHDEHYFFEEVQIISVQTSELDFERNHHRIADLVQKYIPYPILLCIWHSHAFVLNTCDKKINQNDSSRRTIEKKHSTEIIGKSEYTVRQQAFLNSLGFPELDKTNLKTYYDSYTQRMIALQAAELSGVFTPRTRDRTQSDMEKLEKIETLQNEIQLLQNQAKKESQLNQRVALNKEIHEKRKQTEQLKALITA